MPGVDARRICNAVYIFENVRAYRVKGGKFKSSHSGHLTADSIDLHKIILSFNPAAMMAGSIAGYGFFSQWGEWRVVRRQTGEW